MGWPPASRPLLGDIWAGLFKTAPRLLRPDEVPVEVRANHPVMQKLMSLPEYEQLRAVTKLDELASALGTVHLGDKLFSNLKDVVDGNTVEAFRRAAGDAARAREKAEAAREAAELLRQAGQKDKAKSASDRARKQAARASRCQKKADELAEQMGRAVQAHLGTPEGEAMLAAALAGAAGAAMDEINRVDSLLGGLGWGTGPGFPRDVSPKQALALAEYLAKSPDLRRVADLAGRARVIAARKQRQKTGETVERADVATGNDPARLLPGELVLSRRARLEFLRRFAEGELLQYDHAGRERLGRGPLVCIDTSGSMSGEYDVQAKAVMVALLAVAKQQKRAFAVVNFAGAGQVRTWKFPRPQELSPQVLVEMVEYFWDGGTDFESPLSEAAGIIREDRFKKADVVFITDGDAMS